MTPKQEPRTLNAEPRTLNQEPRTLNGILIPLISGIALSFAFPRANLHWIAWFALAPMMYYIYRLPWKGALLSGLAFGLGYFGSLLYWILIFGKLPWAALVTYEALHIVIFAVLAKAIGGRLGLWGRFALLPALWIAIEWFRALGTFGFTWGDLGYSQFKVLPLIQIAAVTGVWGVSLILAMSNAALANLALARKLKTGSSTAFGQVFLVMLIVLGVTIFGLAVERQPLQGKEITAAVIQGNINQDVVQDFAYRENVWDTYTSLTLDAASRGANLIVWPESVIPGCPGRDPADQFKLHAIARHTAAALLVGGHDEDEEGNWFNCALLVTPKDGLRGKTSKVHLVPFGEYIPARKYMPSLKGYRAAMFDVSPALGRHLLDTGSYKVGAAICFESIFPYIARELTRDGAEVLCIITNDVWFLRSPAAEQHMSKSVFRAIENHRYLLRAASTGVSAIIDPNGRILDSQDIFRRKVIVETIRFQTELTFYTRHGDWLIYLSLVLAALLAIRSRITYHASRLTHHSSRSTP